MGKRTRLLHERIVATNVHVVREDDPEPDVSYLDQKGFEDRREAHGREEFNHIGIHAVADLVLLRPKGVRLVVGHVQSGGVWGIESDMDAEFLDEEEQDQLREVHDYLTLLGVQEE